jgi:hypothetical protein
MALVLWAVSGCVAVNRLAVNKVADALSAGGTVFASDEDPDLVREAIPFGLKTYESLLATAPEHRGLLRAAASGFSSYAYLLQNDADLLESRDVYAAEALRARAKRLFLRGRDYALRGLELDHAMLTRRLLTEGAAALSPTRRADVPLLYWAGVGWAGALGTAKNDPLLLAELPLAAALVERVLTLDETFEAGAAHEFFVTYEAARPGGDPGRARLHYARARDLQRGRKASLHLALAEGVCVQAQLLDEFKGLLQAAIAVDPNDAPEWRVVNTLAQRRARWLAERLPELFIEAEES